MAGRTPIFDPPTDIVAYRDRVEIVMDLPGASREDIAIEADGRIITVTGKRSASPNVKDHRPVRKEGSHGVFLKTFRMEATVDPVSIHARMTRGVLIITIPLPGLDPMIRIRVD
jgi:HSP20 family protein